MYDYIGVGVRLNRAEPLSRKVAFGCPISLLAGSCRLLFLGPVAVDSFVRYLSALRSSYFGVGRKDYVADSCATGTDSVA